MLPTIKKKVQRSILSIQLGSDTQLRSDIYRDEDDDNKDSIITRYILARSHSGGTRGDLDLIIQNLSIRTHPQFNNQYKSPPRILINLTFVKPISTISDM